VNGIDMYNIRFLRVKQPIPGSSMLWIFRPTVWERWIWVIFEYWTLSILSIQGCSSTAVSLDMHTCRYQGSTICGYGDAFFHSSPLFASWPPWCEQLCSTTSSVSWCSDSTGQSNGAKQQWIKTMSQIKSFLLLSCLSQVFCHSIRKE
jgi:hypothetical protein